MEDLALLPKTIFDERFEILGLAGSGGMGSVYLARHINMDKLVAIKLLRRDLAGDVEATRRFRREARTARDLNHKNIAAVRFFGINDGQPYIVFDYLEGETLQTILNRHGKLDHVRFLKLFTQLCAGLGHAHSHGVIHRDIKPGNIFCLAQEEVKILDFGIAKIVESKDADAQRLTGTGVLLGTPFYMSPEQGRGEAVAGQSDIYALGCLMYHCCFGQPPFTGDSAYQILYNHTYEQPALNTVPPGYPQGILIVLSKCLAKDAVDRYANMDELSEALQTADSLKVDHNPSAQIPVLKVPPLPRLPAIPWRWISTIVVAVVFACATAVLGWRAFSEHSTPAEGIKTDWSINHNPTILRSRFRQLAQAHPDQARQLMKDLRGELLINPCYETAAMFLDEVELVEEGRHDKAQRPELDDCAFILRELPPKAWNRTDANPMNLVRIWTEDRRTHFTKNAEAMMGLYLALAMGLDGNSEVSAKVADFSVASLSRDNDFSAPETGTANVLADRLWTEDSNAPGAVRLLELADSPTEAAVHVPNLIKRAQIYDGVQQVDNALPLWKEAVESAKLDAEVTAVDGLKALQGLADDEAATGHKESALAHYQQVMSAAMKLPADPYRWTTLARLGDGYALLKDDPKAVTAFAQEGLADCRVAYALPDTDKTHLLRLRALLSMAQFLSRMGRQEEAWPLYTQVLQGRATLKKGGKRVIDDGLVSLAAVQDQIKCHRKLSTLAGSLKEAATAADAELLRNSLGAEWCRLRGDLLGCAKYHETAARYCRQIIGNEAHGDMVLAATMRYRLDDGWPKVIDDATLALQGSKDKGEQSVLKLILGHAWLKEGHDQAARAYLQAGLEPVSATKDPLRLQGWFDLGVIAVNAGQPSVAKAHFRRGFEEGAENKVTTDKNFRRLGFALIKLLRQTHDETGAIALIDRFRLDSAPIK